MITFGQDKTHHNKQIVTLTEETLTVKLRKSL
jgi:hypothetical protein